nr:hypothetical protein GCM10020093_111570 [Planobispora longispora]
MLPPGIVAGIARSSGVTGQDADRLTAELGVEVRPPDPLPETPPYAGYGRAREALTTLGRRHLADFLFGGRCARMRVLDGFSVPGAGPLAEEIRKVEAEWERRTRGPWTTGADTVLAALRGASDPAALLRYDVVTRLRERVREHSSDDTLLRHAVDELNLAEEDARRLVFAVRQEGGAHGAYAVPAARLRELIEAGEIMAAVDLAAALESGTPEAGSPEPGTPETGTPRSGALTGEAADLAAEARARLSAAVELRERALNAADPDEAWIMLQDALLRVPGLPGAGELLARLAPHPAREPRAEVRDDAVVLTWRPSPSRAGEISYEVLRDGVLLAAAPPGPSGFRDGSPPVDVPVTYSVVARRGRPPPSPCLPPRSWSGPSRATCG